MISDHLKTHPKWDHDEFLSFLLLYASRADMEYTADEQEYIKSKVHQGALEKVLSEFEACKDFECLQILESYRGEYFSTPEQKAELLVRIEELFESDGEYTTTENNLFMMLRKLL